MNAKRWQIILFITLLTLLLAEFTRTALAEREENPLHLIDYSIEISRSY